jgi:hypothetical protein
LQKNKNKIKSGKIGMIYIEPLASRPTLAFWKSNESYGKKRNVERKIFETLWHVTIVGKGVATLVLGLPPKQGLAKVLAKSEA